MRGDNQGGVFHPSWRSKWGTSLNSWRFVKVETDAVVSTVKLVQGYVWSLPRSLLFRSLGWWCIVTSSARGRIFNSLVSLLLSAIDWSLWIGHCSLGCANHRCDLTRDSDLVFRQKSKSESWFDLILIHPKNRCDFDLILIWLWNCWFLITNKPPLSLTS